MKPKFFITILFGTWMTFHALASQTPAPPSVVKSVAASTKVFAVKNPAVSGNLQNHGHDPASVGGPAKSAKGTGEIAGTAVAHKR